MTLNPLPRCRKKCDSGTYPAYCGDTCNCGHKEYKRLLAYQTLNSQLRAVNERWAKTLNWEAHEDE